MAALDMDGQSETNKSPASTQHAGLFLEGASSPSHKKKTLPYGDVSVRVLSQKKTLPFGDVSSVRSSHKKDIAFRRCLLLGCPDGLEPSTFRTTSNLSNSPIVPLFIDVCDFIENRVCVDFASISAPVIIFKILFQRTLVLLLENFLQFAFIRSF